MRVQLGRCQECGAENGLDDEGHIEEPHDINCTNRRVTDPPVRIHHLG